MEAKKNPGADLERSRGIFMNVGFSITMLIMIAAFNYASGEQEVDDLSLGDVGLEEMIDIPITEQPPPPPPPPPAPPEIVPADIEEIEEDEELADLFQEFQEDASVSEMDFFEEVVEEVADEVFEVVEDFPEFPGGQTELYRYLGENIDYPSQARRMSIQGRVFVQFIVEPDGSVSNVQAVRGIGAGCDEEAERVIKAMPRWTPGRQRGRPVRVKMIVPINFILN